LVLPPLLSAFTLVTSTAFLIEFLSASRWRPLSAMTQAPVVRSIRGPAGAPPLAADLYVSPSLLRPSGLVLVHGITPRGKADPQLRTAAELLARAGWAVAVPTIDGLTALRLRPDDAGTVTGAARALLAQGYRPVAMLGISLGAAPTLSAAGEPELAPSLSAVLTLGGYASSRELLRYTLTGAYAFGDARGRRPVDEDGIARFARANADLVERGSRSLVDNRDPDKVDRLIDALPEDTRQLLDALSPELDLPRIRVPLFLIHGRGDRTVPFTESLRLDRRARAAGRPVRTIIVGALGHVEPGERATVSELVASWAAFYAFRVTAARVPR
jgi:fermentation-respiration switch protein FrsA (DUF1100 family)